MKVGIHWVLYDVPADALPVVNVGSSVAASIFVQCLKSFQIDVVRESPSYFNDETTVCRARFHLSNIRKLEIVNNPFEESLVVTVGLAIEKIGLFIRESAINTTFRIDYFIFK